MTRALPDLATSPHASRNAQPIFSVLRDELPSTAMVLEIGSGTGQHAVYVASRMPGITWQSSDVPANFEHLSQAVSMTGLPNLLPSLAIDVREARLEPGSYDAVFTANTAHIMHVDAVRAMFDLVGNVLKPSGQFFLYGPIRRDGIFNSASNRAFDGSLRARDPGMGLRDIELLDDFGERCGMRRFREYGMPAHNNLVVWTKDDDGDT